MFCKEKWFKNFFNVVIEFLLEGMVDYIFDIVILNILIYKGKKFFRYYNCWKEVEGYSETVKKCWEEFINGNLKFKLVKKLIRFFMI